MHARDEVWLRRRADIVVVAMSLVSTGAMLGLSQRADERFNPYRFGGPWLTDPTEVVRYAIAFTRETAAEIGNVRPFGRMVENADYVASELVGRTTGLPAHVTFGLLRMLSAVLLGLVLVRLARRLTGPASWAPLVAAGAFPALLVAYGNSSSMVVFSAMYLQTTLLVVGVAWLVATPSWYAPGRPAVWQLGAMAALGFGIAWFNELAWIAVPCAGATLVGLLIARRVPLRTWHRIVATRLSLAAAAGFLATAVPTRIAIQRACTSAGRSCYAASDPELGGVSASLLLARLQAGLPLKAWDSVSALLRQAELRPVALLLLLALVPLLWSRRAHAGTALDDAIAASGDATAPGAVTPGRHLGALALVGASLMVSGAAISALSPILQETSNPLLGWREAPVAFSGWALLLAAAGTWLVERLPRAGRGPALALVTALGVTAAVVATGFQHDRDASDPRLLLADRIAVEIASFDPAPEADARRCALLEEFAALHTDVPGQTVRMVGAVADITEARYRQPFCSEAPPT